MSIYQERTTNYSAVGSTTVACMLLLPSPQLLAATLAGSAPNSTWNMVIALLVLAATAGSAILNIAAIRQWDRNWGLVSGIPLLGLLLWCAIIAVSKQIDPNTHQLWALEIFAWAMINMIYMVTAMTAKRMFAKRDIEESTRP